jgi:hypothetical protein
VASSLGDNLQPVLEHLGSTAANDAKLVEFERGTELFLEFLIAALKQETSNDSSNLVVRMLKNGLPGESKQNEFEEIVECLKGRAPEHLQRLVDAISFVVSCLSLYQHQRRIKIEKSASDCGPISMRFSYLS